MHGSTQDGCIKMPLLVLYCAVALLYPAVALRGSLVVTTGSAATADRTQCADCASGCYSAQEQRHREQSDEQLTSSRKGQL